MLVTEKSFSWKNGVRFGMHEFETVGLDRDPPALTLTPLELRRQHDVQKRVTGSQPDPAPHSGLDMFEQQTGVLIHPQINRDVEGAAADFAEALQVFERLPGPQGSVFGEEIVGADLVGDAEPPRELDVPRPANQGDVIRWKDFYAASSGRAIRSGSRRNGRASSTSSRRARRPSNAN